MEIIKLQDDCYSNSFYGGKGKKIGIIYNNEKYMFKMGEYPKKHKLELSHTMHWASEYIGSKIVKSLDLPVQEVAIGMYNNKLGVLCKDFREAGDEIVPIQCFQNAISEITSNLTLENILTSIKYQKFLPFEIVKKRFMELMVVDAFIANPDRHNENWGLLKKADDTYELAPIYDNGSSLYPLISDDEMEKLLISKEYKNIATNTPASYISYGNKKINFKDFLSTYKDQNLTEAIENISSKINFNFIEKILEDTPISNVRQEFLLEVLKIRKTMILDYSLKIQKR